MGRRDDPTFLNFPRVVQVKVDVPWVAEREQHKTLILADMEGIAAQDGEGEEAPPLASSALGDEAELEVGAYDAQWGSQDVELQHDLDALLGLGQEEGVSKERRAVWSGAPTTDGFRRGLRAELGDDGEVALLMARAAGSQSVTVTKAAPRTRSDPARHRISTSELEVLFAPGADGYSEPLGELADVLARRSGSGELHARLECMVEVASAARGRTQSGPATALALPAQKEEDLVRREVRRGGAETRLTVGVGGGPPLDLLGALGVQSLAVFPMMEAQGGWPLGPAVALAPLLGGVGLWLGGRGFLGPRASRACLWLSAAVLLAFLALPALADALQTFRAFGHGLPHLLGLLPLWLAVVPALQGRGPSAHLRR